MLILADYLQEEALAFASCAARMEAIVAECTDLEHQFEQLQKASLSLILRISNCLSCCVHPVKCRGQGRQAGIMICKWNFQVTP